LIHVNTKWLRVWHQGRDLMMEPMMKKLRTLYLIAAEDGFRLLHTHEPDLAEIAVKSADDFSDVAYSYPNQQSRSHGGPSNPGFETGGSANKIDEERLRFARHIVAALGTEWATGNHDQIVLSAGPKMLGQLRDLLPKALHAHVVTEMHKDLMKIPVHDLASHFKDVPIGGEKAGEGA
jgi:protein required for attachment to host cells